MQGSLQNNKHTEQDKKEEIRSLVVGQSYNNEENDKRAKTTISEKKK
jgi:hypothetical protein